MTTNKPVSAMGHSTRRVVRELRNKILRGELAPGAALRQEDLARQLGVSRVPLREALLVLTGDGLLVHRPNQGFGVAERSRSELSQVYLMLSLPEEELTRTLEWPPDAELLGELRHLNGQMAALVDDVDWLDMVPLNHAFHHAIWQLSPLKLVIGEVDRVWALADAYIASGYSSRSARAHTVEEHDRIIAALASRGRAELTAALVADAGDPDLLQDLAVGTVEPLQRGLAARAGELAEILPLLDLLAAEGGRRGILTTWYQISLS